MDLLYYFFSVQVLGRLLALDALAVKEEPDIIQRDALPFFN
jgi:hypothetical protein